MPDLQDQLNTAVQRLRRAGTDLQDIEVKAAGGGLPKSVTESVSAFANADGGLLILGLDEHDGFRPVPIDAGKLAADLAAACADQLEPPIRAEVDIALVDDQVVVVALISPLPVDQRPCYVKSKGIERGSFLRTHDGDRALTTYEVHILRSSQGQPADDQVVVSGAELTDLDAGLVDALVKRLRETRGPIFRDLTDEEALRLLRVVVGLPAGGLGVTLGGLLALGRFPQLNVTFVAYPPTPGEPLADGPRFTDNQSTAGPIPVMVAECLAVLRRNMRRRSLVAGVGREDRWEYPEEAVRELVANALMHRDYHPLAHGTQVRVSLYPDRLEVASPGGLYGPIAPEDLLAEPVSSSRNQFLAKLLEDVVVPGTNRTVCENRGSGLVATASALRRAGLEPPALDVSVREFRAVVANHGLLDDDALAWLSTIDTAGLTDRQRLGLAFLRRQQTITNQQYRTLTGCDALTATRDLTTLAARGLVVKRRDRRWAVWHLATSTEPPGQMDLMFEEPSAPKRSDRRSDIRALLQQGPLRSQDLADALGLSRPGVLRWIQHMEAGGEVRPTEANRRSPHNRWELVAPT